MIVLRGQGDVLLRVAVKAVAAWGILLRTPGAQLPLAGPKRLGPSVPSHHHDDPYEGLRLALSCRGSCTVCRLRSSLINRIVGSPEHAKRSLREGEVLITSPLLE